MRILPNTRYASFEILIMIPLSEPYLSGNEWLYLKECLDSNWVSSAGSFVNKFEEVIATYTHSPFSIATNSGTSALQLALKLIGVEPGDRVLMPNLTFVATANAIRYLGASPIFIDVSKDYWQMDAELLQDFLENYCELSGQHCMEKESGRKISALIVVHALGYVGDMERIKKLTKQWNISLVEDATEALGSTYKDKYAGTIGDIGCLSFNGNKIITTGGGGMVLTSNALWAQRAKHLSTQAKVSGNDYYHDEIGYNFRLVNILAAMGLAQMEKFPLILHQKRQIAKRYHQTLPQAYFPKILKDSKPNCWLNTIYVSDKTGLINYLTTQKIQSRPLWVPMNQLPMYHDDFYYTHEDVSNNLYKHCVSIPSSANLSIDDQQKVIENIRKYRNG